MPVACVDAYELPLASLLIVASHSYLQLLGYKAEVDELARHPQLPIGKHSALPVLPQFVQHNPWMPLPHTTRLQARLLLSEFLCCPYPRTPSGPQNSFETHSLHLGCKRHGLQQAWFMHWRCQPCGAILCSIRKGQPCSACMLLHLSRGARGHGHLEGVQQSRRSLMIAPCKSETGTAAGPERCAQSTGLYPAQPRLCALVQKLNRVMQSCRIPPRAVPPRLAVCRASLNEQGLADDQQ